MRIKKLVELTSTAAELTWKREKYEEELEDKKRNTER